MLKRCTHFNNTLKKLETYAVLSPQIYPQNNKQFYIFFGISGRQNGKKQALQWKEQKALIPMQLA